MGRPPPGKEAYQAVAGLETSGREPVWPQVEPVADTPLLRSSTELLTTVSLDFSGGPIFR